jgi:hypothetical protein
MVVASRRASSCWICGKGEKTVSIIRKGATKTYADGWEMAFGGKKSNKKSAGGVAVKAKKKALKKKAGKKKK